MEQEGHPGASVVVSRSPLGGHHNSQRGVRLGVGRLEEQSRTLWGGGEDRVELSWEPEVWKGKLGLHNLALFILWAGACLCALDNRPARISIGSAGSRAQHRYL